MITKVDYVKTAQNLAKRMIEEGDGHGNGYTGEMMLSDILTWGFRGFANWENNEEVAEFCKELGITDLENIIVWVHIKESQ